MKRICLFTNSMFKLGGEQRITTILVNNLIKNNYDVSIIIKVKEEINYDLYNLSKEVKLIFLNSNYDFRLNNIKFYERLRILNRKTGVFKNKKKLIRQFFVSDKMIEDLKEIFNNNVFDIVIGVAGDRSFILSYLKEYINAKLIFWNHLNFESHYKLKGSRYYNEDKFIKDLFLNFDEVVVLTKNDKLLFDSNYSINSTVIGNSRSFISTKKTKLNNNSFLAIGRLTKQKGFDYLIEAMRIFNNENKDWNLSIYGEGSDKQNIIKLISKYKLEDFIKIYNNTDNIKDVYLKHDIYLMTSRAEGFGLVTLEALECGLPIIAFDIPANKEIIKENKNGILIKQFDVEKYAKVMLKLANNKKLLQEMQKHAYLSTNNFTEEIFIKKWKDILQ